MYELTGTSQFKKDYKLIKKRGYDISKMQDVLDLLVTGEALPAKYKEHFLKGNYNNKLECHIEPDWLIIYTRNHLEKLITLIRTGTHSDLF